MVSSIQRLRFIDGRKNTINKIKVITNKSLSLKGNESAILINFKLCNSSRNANYKTFQRSFLLRSKKDKMLLYHGTQMVYVFLYYVKIMSEN